jgi:hypothetical protein
LGLIGKAAKLGGGRKSLCFGTLRCGLLCLFAALPGLGAISTAQQAGLTEPRQLARSGTDSVLPEAPEPQSVSAQQAAEGPGPGSGAPGSVHGVVVDRDGAVYEGAKVALFQTAGSDAGSSGAAVKEVTSDSNGRFNFADVPPGPFKLTVSSNGFTTQVVTATVRPGESYEAKAIVLTMNGTTSEVQVTASQEEIAQEELKQEETQRVLGLVPNFYVVYAPDAPPLTSRQKFKLAWRSSIDPVTFLAVGFFAGIEQANNTFSAYGQGAQGYAKRFGAGYADGFIGTMIGGAILPSWWKQDPRYFYKGTGTIRSRALYAIANAAICKGDNGHWQANYSTIVGGLASGGISNLYYPASSRNGAGLMFENALIGTGEGAIQNLLQEFVVRKFTPHVPNYAVGKP